MGQEHSTAAPAATPEQLSQELALIFANQCYTPLELHCFKEVFKGLAEAESGLKYWNEATLCRYLELPDVLEAGPVLYQMVTFLASYPFWELSPCILTIGNLLKVATLVTERYKKIIKANDADKYMLFYASMAIVDRRASTVLGLEAFTQEKTDEEALEDTLKGVSGFSINQEAPKSSQAKEDEDTMAAGAFELLKTTSGGSPALSQRPEIRRSMIPSDNFLKLVELLLFTTPLKPQTNLASFSEQLSDTYLTSLRQAANAVVASFGIEESPGITYNAFKNVVPNSLPFLFNGLIPLFEHFLFDKSFDLSKRKHSDTETSESLPPTEKSLQGEAAAIDSPLRDPGEILDLAALTQISFFLPSTAMFYRLHHLFSGNTHGFSLGSLEKQVFTWRAPTLLLVRGTLLPETPANSRERSFAESLPPKRFQNSKSFSQNLKTANNRTVTYGAYIPTTWKHTHKTHFGDASTLLFQLSPVHDVFRASAVSKDYVSYTTPNSSMSHAGINFGSPLPSSAGSKATGHSGHATESSHVALGPVSLYLDDALEYGVFTHTAAGGGSFYPSVSPARTSTPPQHTRSPSQTFDWGTASMTTAARRRSRAASLASAIPPSTSTHPPTTTTTTTGNGDWQDRFEIEALEIWGFGGSEEMERQRRRIEGEEREARLRKEGIIGRTGDVDVDREILMMAGLIGQNQHGGSIQ